VNDFGFGLLQNTGCSACEHNISQFYRQPSTKMERVCCDLACISGENTHLNSLGGDTQITCVRTTNTGVKFNNVSAEIVSIFRK